jgi:hypothetical protein
MLLLVKRLISRKKYFLWLFFCKLTFSLTIEKSNRGWK